MGRKEKEPSARLHVDSYRKQIGKHTNSRTESEFRAKKTRANERKIGDQQVTSALTAGVLMVITISLTFVFVYLLFLYLV
jgi:hypothetical protein